MDEKGFLMGLADRSKVICSRRGKGEGSIQVAEDGNRESLTVIETVSAGGAILPPLIISRESSISKGIIDLQRMGRNPSTSAMEQNDGRAAFWLSIDFSRCLTPIPEPPEHNNDCLFLTVMILMSPLILSRFVLRIILYYSAFRHVP